MTAFRTLICTTLLFAADALLGSCSVGLCDAACDSEFRLELGGVGGAAIIDFAGTVTVAGTTVELSCPDSGVGSSAPSAVDVDDRQLRINCGASAISFALFPPQTSPWSLTVQVDLASSSQGAFAGPAVVSFDERVEICERRCYVGSDVVTLQ